MFLFTLARYYQTLLSYRKAFGLKKGQKVAFDLFEFPSIADSQSRRAKNVQILED